MTTSTNNGGLDGVVVADTVLSGVDGEAGRLVLCGFDIEDVAGRIGFEDAVHLLQNFVLPTAKEREDVRQKLGAARVRAFTLVPRLELALALGDGMEALRACLAQLPDEGPEAVLGAVPVFAAAWQRTRDGLHVLAPDPALGHAADFLRMVSGNVPSPAQSRALDTYLVTVADHGMNASTFTARVVASTGSDTVSAVTAALGALKGPLHGGAPGPVLDMLDAIGRPEDAAAWIEGELAAGRRIMGMGHRIYRVRDPRAAVLEQATLVLEAEGTQTARLALARAVELAATGVLKKRHPARPLLANVEFYTAVLLDAVGLPRTMFSPAFAVGRAAGWLAHIQEQRQLGRLIRPDSRYVGPMPGVSALSRA